MFSPEGHMANVAYNFAQYVQSAVATGETENVLQRAQEVQDVALKYITEDFRDCA